MYTCLFIHLFCRLARSGLPGQLIKTCQFLAKQYKAITKCHYILSKNVFKEGFSTFFSELLDSSYNIFYWKPAEKNKVDVVFGKNLGQIRSNVVKKGIWGDTFYSKKNCLFKHLSESVRQIYLEMPHLKDIRAKFFAQFESKMAKNWLFSSISLYLVSFNVTNGIIIQFRSFLTKMLLKELNIWAFWIQNVGPGWVKNGKKGCFHTSHLTINPVSPKNKVLNSHSLLAH